MAFPVSPDVFCRIEFGRISRETCQEHMAALPFQKSPQLATSMNGQAIPNDKEFSSHLAAQMGQEVQHLRGADRPGIEAEVELPPRNAGDHRKLFPVKMKFQLRRLPAGRPCATDMRTLADAAFVYKDNGAALAKGFFLRAGQVYRFQRRIASSSRSRALLEGRWQLHPRLRSTFQTWPGWYVTPQVLRITTATLGKVQRLLLYPCTSGPSIKARLICSHCRWVSRDFRPVRPAERRPTRPSLFNKTAQRDTDISLTPIRRATSAWLSPLRKSTAASRRRCSRARMAPPSRFIPFWLPMWRSMPHGREDV